MEIYKDAREWKCILKQTTSANKFYEMMLMMGLDKDEMMEYYVICRYGRVGYKGRTIKHPYGGSILAAKYYFEKQFKMKTGNEWSEEFVCKAGKYCNALEVEEKNKE